MEAANLTNDTVADARNPLLNDVVLARLFEICELSDLHRFRLVSKQWYSVSLTRFRNKMTVVIGHPAVPEPHDKIQRKLVWSSVHEYLHVGGDLPFRNFRIYHMEFGLPNGTKPRTNLKYDSDTCKTVQMNMAQFWGKHGRWIRRLELMFPLIHCRRGLKYFQKAIFEKTPNLEALRLILRTTNENESQNGQRDWKIQPNLKHLTVIPSASDLSLAILPWTLLLKQFPNVQSVEIPIFPSNSGSSIIDIARLQHPLTEISQQLTSRKQAQFKIRKLDLALSNMEHVRTANRLLQLPRLVLKELGFHFEYESELRTEEEMELLSTIYRIHGSNIKHLRVSIREASPSDNLPLQPGPITSLTTLDLWGTCFQNFHFLENFPKLQVLTVISDSDEIVETTDPGRMENIRLHELKEFTLILDDNDVVPGWTMELLAKSIPNVSFCGIQVSNFALRVICREWKQLKQLSITNYADEVDDEGITGIVAGSEVRLPNITDLIELDSFAMMGGEGFGDSSIWNAFLELHSLKNIHVVLSPETSKEAYEALKEKFPEPDGFIVCSRWDTWNI